MAVLDINFEAESLARTVDVKAVVPNDLRSENKAGNPAYDRAVKTLILLHGFGGHSGDWLYKSLAQRMAVKYNIAVFMPSGENRFYLDAPGMGQAYGTFVGKELPDYLQRTFHLSGRREDTYIGGLSMGGFGAIHTGYAFPETFGGIFAFSSALVIHDIAGMKEDCTDMLADYAYYRSVFGNLDMLEASEKNPEVLIQNLQAEGKSLPGLYMACGTEDPLRANNRAFDSFLKKSGVRNYEYREYPGAHDWEFWTGHFEEALLWLLENV